MTIQECYKQMGGDFSQMQNRIPNESMICKFIAKFPSDGSFSELCLAMDEGNREKAFRAAHTLKGVCGNLSIDKLRDSVSQLTELLRPEADEVPKAAYDVLNKVKQDYESVVNTINVFLSAN